MDMGTGKTQVALDFIGSLLYHKRISQAVIICRLRGIPTWEEEFEALMQPGVNYIVLRPGPLPVRWEKYPVIIVNYEYGRIMADTLLKLKPDVVIIDESHRIKNPNARQSRVAHRLGKVCRFAMALTGTPIGNRPLDLWSQFKFLKPELLDKKFREFKQKYAIWGGFGGYELRKYRDLKTLAKIVHPYVKTYKKNIGVEKRFIEVPVDMPASAKKHYQTMEKEFVAFVSEQVTVSAPIVLAKMTKLSQIAGGFIKDTETDQEHELHTAKLEALKELTDSLLDQEEKRVVIFSRFLWEIKRIKELLAPDWVTYTIQGGIKVNEQKLAESLFKSSGGAMICQIASGSESINLQSSRYCIFYSCDYSSIHFQQAQDRIHRKGQKNKEVFYYVLMSRGTIDRRVYRILKEKKSVADEMMELVRKGGVI